MEKVIERFLRYAKFDTESSLTSGAHPSAEGEMVLAKALVEELKSLGLSDAEVDENGYVMATLKSNMEGNAPVFGLIAHMDTSPDMSGKDVKPQFVEYKGGDIVLNKEKNIVMKLSEFPELEKYKGETLITSDGTTLLGADDKAGVSEIMSAIEYLVENPEIEHGDIRVAFTPDEEIGQGADNFDVKKFNAKFAYTVDGGALGEFEYESFNAASGDIVVKGRNVHPGSAKNKMVNSMLIASEFIQSLPSEEVPEKTEGYEGFYHLLSVKGEVERTELSYIIRDHDKSKFEEKKANFKACAEALNKKYGEGTVEVVVKDSYYNMKEKVKESQYVIDLALKAMENAHVKPNVIAIRGGTDGARLSFMGLPTPNIFTGGENFHGRYEYISVNAMTKAVDVLVEIAKIAARM